MIRRYNGGMVKDRRRFLSTLVFVGIFVPFLMVFTISLMTPAPIGRSPTGLRCWQ